MHASKARALLVGRADEDLTGLGSLLRTDDAVGFHLLQDPRRPVVADLELALHERDRRDAVARDDVDGLIEELVDAPRRAPPSSRSPGLRRIRVGSNSGEPCWRDHSVTASTSFSEMYGP